MRWILVCSFALLGCGNSPVTSPPDAGPADAGVADAGRADAGPLDAGPPRDAGPPASLVAPLVPWPRHVDLTADTLTLRPDVHVVVNDPALDAHAAVVALELARAVGLAPVVGPAAGGGDILLRLDPAAVGGPEGYSVVVDADVTISAPTLRGVAHGTSLLVQLVKQSGADVVVPRGRIDDAPEYPFRGLMLDSTTAFHPVSVLRQAVDICRMYRIRYLHLHLTDNLIFTYPSTVLGLGPTPTRYTREELDALVLYSRARGVEIIPEIDLPGHASALTAEHPELRAVDWIEATVGYANETVITTVGHLVEEVIDTFPDSPYFHLGCDEVEFTAHYEPGGRPIDDSPDFQDFYRRTGTSDPQEPLRAFLGRMNDVVRARGKEMIVWEGFLPGGTIEVPRNVLVEVFETSYYLPQDLVRDGYTVVNSTGRPLYFVYDHGSPLDELYSWTPRFWHSYQASRPSYAGITLPDDTRLAGAEFCAWENPPEGFVPGVRERAAAMSERSWSPGAGQTLEDFTVRMHATDALLDRLWAAP